LTSLELAMAACPKDEGRGRKLLVTVVVCLSWFVLNISIGSLTKYLYTRHDFNFPLFLTMLHMVYSSILCAIYLFCTRPNFMLTLRPMEWIRRKVWPLALCFTLSVGLGNVALNYIYPSFGQMLSAASPFITLAMTVSMTTTRFNTAAWISVPVTAVGIAFCVEGEVHFNLVGVFALLGAIVLRGAKSIIQGQLLTSPGDKLDSVALLFYMAPVSAVLLLVASAVTEGMEPYRRFLDSAVAGEAMALWLVVSGLNACFLNVANFLVTFYTSPVALQILGNIKMVLAIVMSAAVLGNPVVFTQGVGCTLAIAGVACYTFGAKSWKAPVTAPVSPGLAGETVQKKVM